MLPQPLHPAVVHFPIVLAVLLPVATLAGILAVRRGGGVRPSWLPAMAVAFALAASAFAAVRTGEAEEDAVERVVAEAPLHEHEERAELFLPLTFVGLLMVAGGLAPGRAGSSARWASLVVALAITALGLRVGHSGGELVYVHGAGQAYAEAGTGSLARDDPERGEGERRDDEGRGGENPLDGS
jgi:uncharacterized membrane protein